ncbi:hypothetical protein AMJ80_10960 [bacterium SM23_31]|nr:MAG: hypothetical protein AMJ80_10960 [bacterium SM23_31]
MAKLSTFSLMFCIVLCLAVSTFGFQAPEREYVIYNNFAYIIETRTLQFIAGEHSYTIADLPEQIQRESIFIDKLTGGIEILQQQFDANVFNFNRLLNEHRGRPVQITLIDGEIIQGAFYGISGSDFLLRIRDSFIAINKSSVRSYTIDGISSIPPFKSALNIFASSRQAGQGTMQIHYLVNNIGWTGEYVGMYDPGADNLQIKSWARIKNNSGSNIDTDKIILIAGEPHKAVGGGPVYPQAQFALRAADVEQAAAFQVEEAYIYHKYTLEQQLKLETNNEQQVRLFPENDITIVQKFIFDVSRFGDKVMNTIEFTNDSEAGVGQPIPMGTIRLYQVDDRGSVFLGEDNIKNTPLDGLITLQIGVAFDITRKRTQKQYRRIDDRSREETYEIELSNASDEVKEVIVDEHFFGEWRILASTIDYTIPDSRTAEFKVTIPPEDKVVFSYTVRYN